MITTVQLHQAMDVARKKFNPARSDPEDMAPADVLALLDMIVAFVDTKAPAVVEVPTYAAMRLAATGAEYKRIKVRTDEDKGALNTIYEYWPGVSLDWIINIEET